MPPAVVVHLAAALAALTLGIVVLARRKGTPRHKAMGRVWVALIVVAAMSSFWIRESAGGRFSAIHLLSVWTLLAAAVAIYAIRKRNVVRHRAFMIGTFAGLSVAGALALGPGRFLGDLLFGW